VVLVALAYGVVTDVFFVQPGLGSVRDPQAVVVLGGYGDRLAAGVSAARADGVRTLVVSVPSEGQCPREGPGLQTVCFVPVPASTRGEAQAIAHLAHRRGWDRIVVVAGTTQISRARLRIERCYPGQMAFVGADPDGFFAWVHEVVYDEAAMLKALLWQRTC
jgi:uncharacterized SAM-binding protein YcdF (DUF218 family)